MLSALLLGTYTNNLTKTTSSLSMLTTDLKVPVVTKTTVSTRYETTHFISYRIFLRRLRSSRREAWIPLETICLLLPVSKSFCLFKNHSGILYWRGLLITATIFSISSLLSSPALQHETYRIHFLPSVNIDFSLLTDSSGKTTTNTLDSS